MRCANLIEYTGSFLQYLVAYVFLYGKQYRQWLIVKLKPITLDCAEERTQHDLRKKRIFAGEITK